MSALMRNSVLIAVLCAVLSCCYQVAAYAGTKDELYEARLDKGLRNTDEYAYYLLNLGSVDNVRAKEHLERALRYSPDLPAVYFGLAGENCSITSTYASLEYFRQGLKAYGRNFWWRFSLKGLLYLSLMVSYLAAMLVLMLIRYPSELSLFIHDVKETKWPAVLFLLVIVLSLLGPFAFIAGFFFITGLYLKRPDRVLVYLSFVLLFMSPFFEKTVSLFLSAPSKETRAVVAVNEGRDSRYALSVLKPGKGFIPSFSLALALKREGRYDEAVGFYRALLKDHADPAIHVNLGNLYYAAGNAESAVNSYLEALKVRPLVSAYYNLSQVRRESFDFAKSDEYFLKAAGIDHQALSRLTSMSSRSPNRFVADEVLPSKDVWEYAMASNISKRFGYRDWIVFAVAISLVITFYFFDNWVKLRAYRCRRCGEVACSRCNRALTWGGLCPDCYRSFVRMDGIDPRERVSRLLSIYHNKAKERVIVNTLNLVLPGSAQIFSGKIVPGFLFLWPFLFFLVMLIMNLFISVGPSPVNHGWVNPLCVISMALIYLLSLFNTRGVTRREWR